MKSKFYENGTFCEDKFIKVIKEGRLSKDNIIVLENCLANDPVSI